MSAPTIRIEWLDDSEDNADVSLATFLSINADDTETCERVAALKPGESFTVGGGAQPAARLTMIAEVTR